MEEKKLTDEEIVKELINESNRGEWCELSFIDCVEVRVLKNAIDLIHRQKAEIERLTSLYDGQTGFMTSSIGDLPLTVDGLRKAVDEISRLLIVQTELQELNAKYYNEAKDLRRENAKIRKQVNELKFDKELLQKLIDKREKDTAKEILTELIERAYYNGCIDLTVNEVKAWFIEDYNVEVE